MCKLNCEYCMAPVALITAVIIALWGFYDPSKIVNYASIKKYEKKAAEKSTKSKVSGKPATNRNKELECEHSSKIPTEDWLKLIVYFLLAAFAPRSLVHIKNL